MTEDTFEVGQRVRYRAPGSWADGRTGTVERLDAVSPDGIRGHVVRVDGQPGYTVLEPHCLTLVSSDG
jgi:hypothetical protein